MLESRDPAFFAANFKGRNRAHKPLVDPRARDHFDQQNAVIAVPANYREIHRGAPENLGVVNRMGLGRRASTPLGAEHAISEVPQGAMAFVTGIAKAQDSMQNNLVSA
jgi:hypothetical protein